MRIAGTGVEGVWFGVKGSGVVVAVSYLNEEVEEEFAYKRCGIQTAEEVCLCGETVCGV